MKKKPHYVSNTQALTDLYRIAKHENNFTAIHSVKTALMWARMRGAKGLERRKLAWELLRMSAHTMCQERVFVEYIKYHKLPMPPDPFK